MNTNIRRILFRLLSFPFLLFILFSLIPWLHLLRLSSLIFYKDAFDTACNDLPLFLCLSLLTGSGHEPWLVPCSCIETLPTEETAREIDSNSVNLIGFTEQQGSLAKCLSAGAQMVLLRIPARVPVDA